MLGNVFLKNLKKHKNLKISTLEVEFCQVNNNCLQILKDSSWALFLKKLTISGCKFIDYDGLEIIVELKKLYDSLDMTDIYEDFKQFFIEKEDGTFELTKEVNVDIDKIFEFFEKVENGSNLTAKEINKTRSLIRNNVMKIVCEDKRLKDFVSLNLEDCGISSETLEFIAKSDFVENLEVLNLSDTNIG